MPSRQVSVFSCTLQIFGAKTKKFLEVHRQEYGAIALGIWYGKASITKNLARMRIRSRHLQKT